VKAGKRAAAGDGGARSTRSREEHVAILAALEHGSHTVGELAVVTAHPGAAIRAALKELTKARSVRRTTREGKAAYALPN
jgi:predicted transcriptional regulator